MVNILLPRSELFIPGGDLLSLGEFRSGIVSFTDLALLALLVLELALFEVLAVVFIVQKELNVKQLSQQKKVWSVCLVSWLKGHGTPLVNCRPQ